MMAPWDPDDDYARARRAIAHAKNTIDVAVKEANESLKVADELLERLRDETKGAERRAPDQESGAPL